LREDSGGAQTKLAGSDEAFALIALKFALIIWEWTRRLSSTGKFWIKIFFALENWVNFVNSHFLF
jgi:hypothetical protein